MNMTSKNGCLKEAAEQIAVNTTGWVGQLPGQKETISRGQTFLSNEEGDLQNIEVYSHIVPDPGKIVLTLHDYDPQKRSWGPVISSSVVEIKQTDSGRWISFHMPELHIIKGKFYGFKLISKNGCVGIGEASGSTMQPPFNPGQEWEFTNDNDQGNCFSYFSLAFKVGIRA